MDQSGFDMDNLKTSLLPSCDQFYMMLQKTLVLTDPQTKDVVFEVSAFSDGREFDRIKKHNYFSMLLVDKGDGQVRRDTSAYPFSAGCLLCFSLYQPFAVHPAGTFEGILINFHPGFFCLFKHRNEVSCNGVLFNNLYDSPVTSLNKEELSSLQTIAAQMVKEMQREKPDPDVVLSYLKIFLIGASRLRLEQQQIEPGTEGKQPAVLDALQQAIDSNFKKRRAARDYSELLHISENALNKLCKQYFYKTLTRLIAERMVIEAKRELYLTDKPVKQVAYELGYTDEFYFSRFFKKNTSVAPQVFRDTVGFDKLNG